MATVIERERPNGVLIERQDNTGWAVAAVVLIALLAIGAFVWARYYTPAAPAVPNTGSSINVSLPASDAGSSGGATGETGSNVQPDTEVTQ